MSLGTKLFLILFMSAALFQGCKDSNNNAEEEKEKLQTNSVSLSDASIKEIGLQTESIKSKPYKGLLTVPAKVIVNQDYDARVGSLVQGRVYKVFVNAGSYVKAGQVLMQIEGLEIGEIKAGFLSAKANLDFYKANFDRQKKLAEQNVGSQKSFLEAQAEYEKAFVEFNAQDKKIHSIGLSDDDIINGKNNIADEHTSGTLPVRAPISGIIVERNVVIGQFVDGNTNAFKIINTSSVWIEGQIYEKDLDKITENTNVVFTTAAYPDDKFTGKIIYTGQIIDEVSRTISVRAEFNNNHGKLKPQMFGDMQIPVNNHSSAMLVPSESITKINNDDFVFVKKNNPDNSSGNWIFEKRRVKTGSTINEFTEIKEGLQENENVVVKGAFYLKSESMKDELGED